MRNKLALTATCLALLVPAFAQADLLVTGLPSSFTFDAGTGGTFDFFGTITNDTASVVDSLNASVAISPGSAVPNVWGDATDLVLNTPALDPGASTGVVKLFTLNIGPNQLTNFNVDFCLTGFDPEGLVVSDGIVPIGANAVPEPGSMALMGVGVLGAAFMARRRRKA